MSEAVSSAEPSQKRPSAIVEYPQRHHQPTHHPRLEDQTVPASASTALQETEARSPFPATTTPTAPTSVNVVAVMRRTTSQNVPTVNDCVGSALATVTSPLTGSSNSTYRQEHGGGGSTTLQQSESVDAPQPEPPIVQTAQYVAPSKIMTRPAGPRRVANSPYAKLQSYSSTANSTGSEPSLNYHHHVGPLPLSSTPLPSEDVGADGLAVSSEAGRREQPELGIDERYDAARNRIFGSNDGVDGATAAAGECGPFEGLAVGGSESQRHRDATVAPGTLDNSQPDARSQRGPQSGMAGVAVGEGSTADGDDGTSGTATHHQNNDHVRSGGFFSARGGSGSGEGGVRGRGHRKTKHAPRGAVSADEQHEYRRSHVAYGAMGLVPVPHSGMMGSGVNFRPVEAAGVGMNADGGTFYPPPMAVHHHHPLSSNSASDMMMVGLPPYSAPLQQSQMPPPPQQQHRQHGISYAGPRSISGPASQFVGDVGWSSAADEYVPNETGYAHFYHHHQQHQHRNGSQNHHHHHHHHHHPHSHHHHHHHAFTNYGAGFAPNTAAEGGAMYAPLSSPPPPHVSVATSEGSLSGSGSTTYPASATTMSVGQPSPPMVVTSRYDDYSSRMVPQLGGSAIPTPYSAAHHSDAAVAMAPYGQYAATSPPTATQWTPPVGMPYGVSPPSPQAAAAPGLPPQQGHRAGGGSAQMHSAHYPSHHAQHQQTQQHQSWMTNSPHPQQPQLPPQPQHRNWAGGSLAKARANQPVGSSSSQPQLLLQQPQQQAAMGGGSQRSPPFGDSPARGGGGVSVHANVPAVMSYSATGSGPQVGGYQHPPPPPPVAGGAGGAFSNAYFAGSGQPQHQVPPQQQQQREQQQQQLPQWTAAPASSSLSQYPPTLHMESMSGSAHNNWSHLGGAPHSQQWKPPHFSPPGFADGSPSSFGDSGGHLHVPPPTFFSPSHSPPPPVASHGAGQPPSLAGAAYHAGYPDGSNSAAAVPSVVVGFARHHQPVVTVSGRPQQTQQRGGGGGVHQHHHHHHHYRGAGRGDGMSGASRAHVTVSAAYESMGSQEAYRSPDSHGVQTFEQLQDGSGLRTDDRLHPPTGNATETGYGTGSGGAEGEGPASSS